ncbi:phosphoenolpyruvate--protein phosphotransferase [Salsuginibacillus kocurii]|uniref:phosphoenolpyruvate--protein phosphotransferase n=1 Tax=Salsuginibacillus kocurii TaxID=427078 RepID=UPI000380C65A|nr:phosphoenolpyruvate--protein phosphotransferase [Salsuginibacillus kocurii]
MANQLQGIAASKGIAIAKAFVLEQPDMTVEKTSVEDPAAESERFRSAVGKAKEELEEIKAKTLEEQGEENAEIFAAHLLVLDDPELLKAVESKISDEKINAESALKDVTDMFVTMFQEMDNEYMQERAADIQDVSKRVMLHLLGVENTSLAGIKDTSIVIAEDLTPSDTAQLNRDYTLGFATDIGGRTSHSAIMARSLELPAVVGTKEVTAQVKTGDLLIIDGIEGAVFVNPDSAVVEEYEKKQEGFLQQKEKWKQVVNESSITTDNHQVELAANIGTPDDLEGVLNNGAEGIGLYRTEFLYMGRNELPSEDEQFEAYKKVLTEMENKPVVIRTLDIGGDKDLPYLDLPEELNPFLGFRAIRLCLEETDMFKTQLRALLRASAFGNLKIMFPMVATIEEFREAKAIFDEEWRNLKEEGHEIAEKIELGIMVEIPSTAVAADLFADEVDFFSIGTNDLIQYTLAADRMSEKVSHLYQPYHPAILRLVKQVIDAAHEKGKWVGMCGEMAGEETAVPILLGLGLDEFSMSATSILPARTQVRGLAYEDVQPLANEVLNKKTSSEVEQFIKEQGLLNV